MNLLEDEQLVYDEILQNTVTSEILGDYLEAYATLKSLNFAKRSEMKLRDKGIPINEKPVTPLDGFSEDLKTIDGMDLGSWLMKYESYAGWAKSLIAIKTTELDKTRAITKFVGAKLRIELGKASKKTAKEVDDLVTVNPIILDLTTVELQAKSDIESLEASMIKLNKYSKAVSREITIREIALGKTV